MRSARAVGAVRLGQWSDRFLTGKMSGDNGNDTLAPAGDLATAKD